MRRTDVRVIGGLLFLLLGVVIVFARDAFAAIVWFALGAAFLVMERPAREVREDGTPGAARFPRSPRNVAALLAFVTGVAFFIVQLIRDIG